MRIFGQMDEFAIEAPVCSNPHCGRPATEFDVENCAPVCSACRAAFELGSVNGGRVMDGYLSGGDPMAYRPLTWDVVKRDGSPGDL